MLAKYINMALSGSDSLIIRESAQEKDELSEVIKITSTWTFSDGVIIRCIREDELFSKAANQCPECWINWTVVDDAGLPVSPEQKNFFNVCQQQFWLKKQLSSVM